MAILLCWCERGVFNPLLFQHCGILLHYLIYHSYIISQKKLTLNAVHNKPSSISTDCPFCDVHRTPFPSLVRWPQASLWLAFWLQFAMKYRSLIPFVADNSKEEYEQVYLDTSHSLLLSSHLQCQVQKRWTNNANGALNPSCHVLCP